MVPWHLARATVKWDFEKKAIMRESDLLRRQDCSPMGPHESTPIYRRQRGRYCQYLC